MGNVEERATGKLAELLAALGEEHHPLLLAMLGHAAKGYPRARSWPVSFPGYESSLADKLRRWEGVWDNAWEEHYLLLLAVWETVADIVPW